MCKWRENLYLYSSRQLKCSECMLINQTEKKKSKHIKNLRRCSFEFQSYFRESKIVVRDQVTVDERVYFVQMRKNIKNILIVNRQNRSPKCVYLFVSLRNKKISFIDGESNIFVGDRCSLARFKKKMKIEKLRIKALNSQKLIVIKLSNRSIGMHVNYNPVASTFLQRFSFPS